MRLEGPDFIFIGDMAETARRAGVGTSAIAMVIARQEGREIS